MGRQVGLGVAAALAALLVLLVAMWALTPEVREQARPPKKVATIAPIVETPPVPVTPKDARTGRANAAPTKPGERASKPETPPPPYMLPILDDFAPGGPPTSPEAMKTPEGRAGAGLQVAWGDIMQGLSDKANYVPEATMLEGAAAGIVDDYRKVRRGESVDWQELQRRQQDLLAEIAKVEAIGEGNPAYDEGLRKLREKLAAYERDKKASGR